MQEQYRINRLNDVHARWALTAGLNGGLCKLGFVPEATDNDWYDLCIDSSTGGTVRAVEAVNRLNEARAAEVTLPVVHVFTGDEFQGTPLFTFDDGESKDFGWALQNMQAYIAMTSVDRAVWLLDVYTMVPGNHEFDAGVPALETYISETTTAKLQWTCGNCNWGGTDCMSSDLIPVYQRFKVTHPVDAGDGNPLLGKIEQAIADDSPSTAGYTMLTIFGMTVPLIHNQAKVPAACEMIDWKDGRFKTRLEDALARSDELWISSHMGIEDDIAFAKWLRDDSGIETLELSKIKGLTGGHSHSVPCGNPNTWDIKRLSTETEFIGQIDRDLMNYDEIVGPSSTTSPAHCYKIDGADCCTLTAEGNVPLNVDGAADQAQCERCDTLGLELKSNNFYPNYPTTQFGLDIYHSGNHGALMAATVVGIDGSKAEYLLPLDATFLPTEEVKQMHLDTFTDALPLLIIANNDERMTASTGGFLRTSCKGQVDTQSGIGVDWSDTNNNLSMSCALGYGMANAYANAAIVEAKQLNMSASGGIDSGALLARLTADDSILTGRVVSIYNGGGIRGIMPDETVTFYDMINVVPFWDSMAVTATSGEQLIANLNHGAMGQKGMQMAGLRALVTHEWDYDTLTGQLSAIATDNSLEMKKLFCDATVIRKADHAARREDDFEFFIRTAESEAMNPIVYEPTPAAIAAATAVADSGLVWQSNSCLGPELFALEHQEIADGNSVLPDIHGKVYADECWVDIVPTDTYLVSTVQFLLNGGDHYCLPLNDTFGQVQPTSFAGDADGQTAYLIQYTNTVDNVWEKLDAGLVLKRIGGPTTQAPTTKAPTTQAPTTKAPTTQAPTTQAPTTQAPTTQAPTTQAPTTKASTTTWATHESPTTAHSTSSAEGAFTLCLLALLSAIL